MITGQTVPGYDQQPGAVAAHPPTVQAPLNDSPSRRQIRLCLSS
jgi:hypothetical protein